MLFRKSSENLLMNLAKSTELTIELCRFPEISNELQSRHTIILATDLNNLPIDLYSIAIDLFSGSAYQNFL